MADLHPAIILFFFSGLLVFWLTPLSAWWMLSAESNRGATIWFSGTALYASVATIFVFGSALPLWVRGPFSTFLTLMSLICMFEALRREVSSRPIPYTAYGSAVIFQQLVMNFFYLDGSFSTHGFAFHLTLLCVCEVALILAAERVRRLYGSRALYLVTTVLGLFFISNMLRVMEYLNYGKVPQLLEFSMLTNSSLILNYVSVVFYCYGYWGFIVEKNRKAIEVSNARAMNARSSELLALQQEEIARVTLRHRSEMMQRMATVGKIAQSAALAGSVAHEINQPLTSILLNLAETRRQLEQTDATQPFVARLSRVEDDCRRISATVQRMKNIFEQKPPPISCNVIDNTLRDVIKLLENELERKRIEVTFQLASPIPFDFSAEEIEHVFLNVIQNAIDALENSVALRRVDIESWRENDKVLVSISDNGPGISANLRDRIFELSETSKKDGFGLGLWLSRYIVERNDGKIELDESYVSGARFIIELPIKVEKKSST